MAKISVFWAKNAKIFKTKKLIKKLRKHSLDTCIKMALVNFCPKLFVLPLLKKNWAKKITFWRFLKNMIISQKSDYLNRFLVKFFFLEMYTFIYFTLLVLSYNKNNFHKKLQFCEGGTILKILGLPTKGRNPTYSRSVVCAGR